MLKASLEGGSIAALRPERAGEAASLMLLSRTVPSTRWGSRFTTLTF